MLHVKSSYLELHTNASYFIIGKNDLLKALILLIHLIPDSHTKVNSESLFMFSEVCYTFNCSLLMCNHFRERLMFILLLRNLKTSILLL